MNKKLFATLIATAGLFGSSVEAASLPVFTVNPTSIAANPFPAIFTNYGPFQADSFSGTSSGRILLNGITQKATETGWVQLQNFNLGAATIPFTTSGLGFTYSMYMTFNLQTSLLSGTFGAAGSSYNIDSLTYTLFAAAPQVAFNPSTLGADGTVNTGASTVTQLATGSVTNGALPNSAVITSGGGVALNSNVTFNLSNPGGPAFFTAPNPFFSLAFNTFNNVSTGIAANYNLAAGCTVANCVIAANTIVSNWTLVDRPVPEPETLALLGIGLLGFASTTMRRRYN